MFETIEAEGFEIASVDENGFLADRPAIATSGASRRLRQWSLRPSYAMLALLLAIGTTWFLTRTTTENKGVKQSAQTHVTNAPSAEMAAASGSNVAPAVKVRSEAPVSEPNPRITVARARTSRVISASPLAQTSQAPAATARPTAPAQEADPADIMLSHRYAKAIEAASKHEVVVSGRDRL